MGFEEAIGRLKEILDGITSPRPPQDIVIAKTVFTALGNILEECKEADVAVMTANTATAALEEACSGKFNMSRCLQTLMVSIYSTIISKAPGYTVRNIAINYLALSSNKAVPTCSRECALNVCAAILAERSFDCGSMFSDIILSMSKIVKSSEVQLRIAVLKVLIALVSGAGSRIGDCHPDILKIVAKYVTDKSTEVRRNAALLIIAIAGNSLGCTSVSPELLLGAVGRGIEDDCSTVQDSFTRAVAAIFAEQIRAHTAAAELSKISLARGGPAPADIPKPKRKLLLKLASAVSSQRKVVEDYQFTSVVTHLIKLITKATSACIRSAQIAVLGHLVKDSLENVDQKDFEWLIDCILRIFVDPFFTVLTHEDQTFFRARMSHFFRYAITANVTEVRQIALATSLIQNIAMERTEQELQYGLGELGHVLCALGDAVVSVAESTHTAVTVHLRHPSFGVRSAAAYVLATSAAMTPTIATAFHRTVLINADTQAKQLIAYEGAESATSAGTGASAGAEGKNSAKEQERLQRMFFFHGHTLALSIFLRNEHKLTTPMPKRLVVETLDFGLELLQQDVLNSSVAVRHIRCSLVRAGSLIVSSCLSTSHGIARLRLLRMMTCCSNLFKSTLAPVLSDEMMMYEMMSVEAAAACIGTLIWTNPKVLIEDMDTLPVVIDGLETALRAVKGKYQKFKTHFRFRTLHIILLECFSWLPPGSCSNSLQPLFVEGLRVLRDSISIGLESTCMLKGCARCVTPRCCCSMFYPWCYCFCSD
jgi:hypothetical protein